MVNRVIPPVITIKSAITACQKDGERILAMTNYSVVKSFVVSMHTTASTQFRQTYVKIWIKMCNFDFNETDSLFRDFLNNVRLPKLTKVMAADGNEKVIDKQCVQDVFAHAFQMVWEHEYSCIDYNDMVTLLQSGEKAVVVEVESDGANRAAKTSAQMVKRIESTGCCWAGIKFLLLHFQFPMVDHKTVLAEYETIIHELNRYAKKCDIVPGFSCCKTNESDSWRVTAIAIY